MIYKKLFLLLFVVFALTGCKDWWDGISNSGSGSEKPASTQVASLPTATSASSNKSAEVQVIEKDVIDVAAITGTPDTASTQSAAEPEPAVAEAAAATAKASSESSSRASDKCVVGKYGFLTTSDNHTHFTAQFESGGRIRYNLSGAPSGKWTLSGKKMDVYGPFKMPGRKYVTLHMTVTKTASDCKIMEFVGKSPGGSNMAVRRR